MTWDVGRTLEEFLNYSPAARDLRILLVFYQHPIETCGLLLNDRRERAGSKIEARKQVL